MYVDEPYDHGWDMPDVRASFWWNNPDDWSWYENIPEDERTPGNIGQFNLGEYLCSVSISIRVKRQWFSDGETGYDYQCRYDVIVDGAQECSFDKIHKAEAYIAAAYPGAEFDEDAYRERQAAARGRPY